MEVNEYELNAKLGKKILAVMTAISGIEKNGRNEHFKYDFVADPDVLRVVRNAITEAGLVILPNISESRREGSNTHIRGSFDLMDTDTGYVRTCLWEGESDDKQDKGISKAATSFVKYFLLKAFLIPTGDDPDAQAPVETKPKKAPKEPVQAKQRKGKPDPSAPFGWLMMPPESPGEWQFATVSDKQFKYYQELLSRHGVQLSEAAAVRSMIVRSYGLDAQMVNKAGGYSFAIEFLLDASDDAILNCIEATSKALSEKKQPDALAERVQEVLVGATNGK